jgi:RHS repeat-associated protein
MNGNLVEIIDARGRPRRYRYDALDRRRAIVYPDESEFLSDYDSDGNLIRTTDNNGLQRHYTVDELGRTTRVVVDKSSLSTNVTVEGATFQQYAYDALDRRIIEENDFAHCEVRVNSLGWPLAETITFTITDAPFSTPLLVARQFNDVGALTELTYPNGRGVHFHRDELNRLTRVQNLSKGTDYPGNPVTLDIHDVISRIEYAGRQRSLCLHRNGTTTTYSHDGAGRLIEIDHASSAGALLRIQYLFDAVGNVRTRHDISSTVNIAEKFAYDSLYRLTNESTENRQPFDPALFGPHTTVPPDPIPNRQAEMDAVIGSLELPAGLQTFGYDLVGNREEEKLADGTNIDYNVNQLDQYTSRDGATFSYDANGNLKQDSQRRYFYDSLNRLVRVEDTASNQTIARFFHDARGRRILELQNGQTTHLVWDGDDLIAEYRNGVPFALYVFDDRVDRALQITSEGGEYWYHSDLVGSVRLLTRQTGSQATAYTYAPFGKVITQAGEQLHNPVMYTGRRLDAKLNTYDYRSRQYDPELGRFLQRDPADGVDGTNLYKYVRNNPLGLSDPLGTDARPEMDRAAVQAFFDEQRGYLDRIASYYSQIKASRQTFEMYHEILDELEASVLEDRSIDVNGLWERARKFDWDWKNTSWMQTHAKGYAPFADSGAFGTKLPIAEELFDASIGREKPIQSRFERLVRQIPEAIFLFGISGGFGGGFIRGSVGRTIRAETRAGLGGLRAGVREATVADALAAWEAEALGGQRVYLVGPGGASTTRGIRIRGNVITYDTAAPSGSQVRADMAAIANIRGIRGQSFVRQGDWWSGTHGTSSGAFGGVEHLEPRFYYLDRGMGKYYGWNVRDISPYSESSFRLLSEGLERPTVFNWCYSSSCLLRQ